ncbi:MAG: DNA polymerase III subunit epsilon [Pseudomonadota bacterium]
MKEIIFDTETTGLSATDGDRIIEIGAIELINRFPSGNSYHVYLNPQGRDVHPDALQIHGISNEFLSDKKTFEQVLTEFDDFFGEGFLVAHNASFDMGFLNAELQRLGRTAISNDRVIDTLQIARRKFPGQRNSLDALCNRFQVDNSHREKHGALLDSELLAEVYLELTGGRQATLGLDESKISSNQPTSPGDGRVNQARQRSEPLKPRLTEEVLAQHKEFIKTLGDDAIWKKTWAGKTRH